MSPGKHGILTPRLRLVDQVLSDFMKSREQGISPKLLEHQGIRKVIYVLACAAKVNELAISLSNILLDKVLHRLEVVVCDLLDLFDSLGTFVVKFVVKSPNLVFELLKVTILRGGILNYPVVDQMD
jgi:hypothetical protein